MNAYHAKDKIMSLLTTSAAYKPFNYSSFVTQAIEHDKLHWGEWECDLNEDVTQWKSGKISNEEKNFITQILRLFTQSDVIVGGSYVDVFLPRIKNNEARMMMLSFAHRETIHMRSYALLNDTLGFPEAEYTAFLEYDAMAEKIEFMQTFDPDTKQGLAKAIAQTVCNEGMSLFSAFVMLLNFQRFGKLKGMCEIVEWSIRDETIHVAGMTELFRTFINENPEVVTDEFKLSIYEMYRTAVLLEDKVIDLAFEMGTVEGLEASEVKCYIRYIADRRLTNLGLKPNWDIEENPLPWLDWVLNGDSFKNFFEGRVTDYSADGMSGSSWGW
jgi:ribonucleoside-diphosphate reductase beta chain|tara:strand:- start:758 stop:1741 length:984 start_codon:yes stop_codon:yes gene_type:complete